MELNKSQLGEIWLSNIAKNVQLKKILNYNLNSNTEVVKAGDLKFIATSAYKKVLQSRYGLFQNYCNYHCS